MKAIIEALSFKAIERMPDRFLWGMAVVVLVGFWGYKKFIFGKTWRENFDSALVFFRSWRSYKILFVGLVFLMALGVSAKVVFFKKCNIEINVTNAFGVPVSDCSVLVWKEGAEKEIGWGRVTGGNGNAIIEGGYEGTYVFYFYKKVLVNGKLRIHLLDHTVRIKKGAEKVNLIFNNPREFEVVQVAQISYNSGSANISYADKNNVLAGISANATNLGPVLILAYCDADASYELNDRLGAKRCKSILNLLLRDGVNRQMLKGFSFGERHLPVGEQPEINPKHRKVIIYAIHPVE